MKIRQGYVSNSSSSSFIIAYDPLFYGDLKTYFKEYSFGCETNVFDINTPFEEKYINEGIEEAKKEGKQILYFSLDQEFYSIIALMKMINESNGGDKLRIIVGDDE